MVFVKVVMMVMMLVMTMGIVMEEMEVEVVDSDSVCHGGGICNDGADS